jgi:hypothetical protein
MEKSRLTESQIAATLKEADAGMQRRQSVARTVLVMRPTITGSEIRGVWMHP